jgi:cobalamin biosynthesis protein CobT
LISAKSSKEGLEDLGCLARWVRLMDDDEEEEEEEELEETEDDVVDEATEEQEDEEEEEAEREAEDEMERSAVVGFVVGLLISNQPHSYTQTLGEFAVGVKPVSIFLPFLSLGYSLHIVSFITSSSITNFLRQQNPNRLTSPFQSRRNVFFFFLNRNQAFQQQQQ